MSEPSDRRGAPGRQALPEAVARERPRLAAWLRRQLPDAAEVEDLLQDALCELFVAAELARPVEDVGAWLFRVLRNRLADRRRRAAVRAEAEAALELAAAPGAVDPEREEVRRRLGEALEEAVGALPPGQRDAFVAHELEGRSFRDLAAERGAGVNTLLSRKHSAVRSLRRRLKELRDELFGE